MNDDILSVPSRRRIYECVQTNPGAHLRDVARRTALPLGTTLYHLDHLEARNMISSRRDGRYKRFFCGLDMGRHEKDVMSALRHDAPRRIVHALLLAGSSTQRGLCAAVGLSRSTLSFHVNQLVDRAIVERHPARPENVYALVDPVGARELLVRYADSLGTARTADRLPIEPLREQARDAAVRVPVEGAPPVPLAAEG